MGVRKACVIICNKQKNILLIYIPHVKFNLANIFKIYQKCICVKFKLHKYFQIYIRLYLNIMCSICNFNFNSTSQLNAMEAFICKLQHRPVARAPIACDN